MGQETCGRRERRIGYLYRCGDIHTYIGMMIEAVIDSDLVVLLIGSNDIVQEPDRVNEFADQVCQIGRELVNSYRIRQVAFVEIFPLFGPKGFEGDCTNLTGLSVVQKLHHC